jgi:hypothetical protein
VERARRWTRRWGRRVRVGGSVAVTTTSVKPWRARRRARATDGGRTGGRWVRGVGRARSPGPLPEIDADSGMMAGPVVPAEYSTPVPCTHGVRSDDRRGRCRRARAV